MILTAFVLSVTIAQAEEKSEYSPLPMIEGSGARTFTKLLFLDQFDKGVLDPGWKWVDPWDDSTLSFPRYSWLEIVAISGNDLQPKANLNAPRLIRQISGDFAVETKISKSQDGSFLSGGLLIWKDEENFIRFDRGTWGFDTIFLQKREEGLFQHIGDWFLSGNPTYLRIERIGGDFNALFSNDGKKWDEATKFNFDLSDPLYVGLHAICFATDFPPTATDFDYFKILSTGNENPYLPAPRASRQAGKTKKQNKLSYDKIQDLQRLEEKKLMERANHVLSKTASERNAFAEKTVITDPKTGLKFRKILSDDKLDVIVDAMEVTLSSDGNLLFAPSPWEDEHWVVPLKEGEEPFRLATQPKFAGGGILGSWSPNLSKFAFVNAFTGDLWVMPVSPETGRPTGPPERIFEEAGEWTDRYCRPNWSPDGKKLAFMSSKGGNLDIWTIPAEGGTPIQLTDDPNPERYPAWAPDGKTIAFNRYREPLPEKSICSDIWLIPAQGTTPSPPFPLNKGGQGVVLRGNALKLIEDVNDSSYPVWSPDGKYISFSRIRDKQYAVYYLFRLSDKREFLVIEKRPEEISWWILGWSKDSKKLLFFSSGYEFQFVLKLISTYGGPWVELGKGLKLLPDFQNWTHDGKAIVTLGWGPDFGCWVIPALGGTPSRIRIEAKPQVELFPHFPLSPDLKKIAFIGKDSSLWVLPISVEDMRTTGPAVKITDQIKRAMNDYSAFFFANWSPDGKKIAFHSTKGGNVDVWVASADGKELIQLTDDSVDETRDDLRAPAWSPDGNMLAYMSKGGIWLIPASGGKPQEVVKEASSDPSLSPDGKELAFIGKSHISIIRLETGVIRNIIDLKAHGLDAVNSWGLSWSPDGKNLAFISYNSPSSRIFVLPVEGGELFELAKSDPGNKNYLSWSPDGKKLSYSSYRSVRVRTGAIWEADVEELLSKIE